MEPFELEYVNLIENSVSQNTWNVYSNGVQLFEIFRKNHNFISKWPAPLSDVINFIVYLAKNDYSPNTAKSYVASIGFQNKIKGHLDTCDSFIVSKLLSGMSKKYKREDIRKPITVKMLNDIFRILPLICYSKYESDLFSAIFAISFCAFLRIGEVVNSGFASHSLQIGDVTLDNNEQSISVIISSSKTDQNSKKSTILVSKNFVEIPVYSLLEQYLKSRPHIEGNLFCHFNHKEVTRNQVVSILKSAIKFLGFNDAEYNTHSMRIGAATYASQMGFSDDKIMLMGRWKSNSYKKYIRIQKI